MRRSTASKRQATAPQGARRLALALIACSGVAMVSAALALPGPRRANARPAVGVLLVADDGMADPRFRETVILLASHDEGGSMGLVLNRPSDVPLHRIFEHAALADLPDRIYLGGPVDLGGILYLLRASEPPEGATHVVADVHLSGSPALLELQFARDAPTRSLRVYTGYAGWAPGQLDHEISRGDWHILRATPEAIFSPPDAQLWRELWKGLSGIAI